MAVSDNPIAGSLVLVMAARILVQLLTHVIARDYLMCYSTFCNLIGVNQSPDSCQEESDGQDFAGSPQTTS